MITLSLDQRSGFPGWINIWIPTGEHRLQKEVECKDLRLVISPWLESVDADGELLYRPGGAAALRSSKAMRFTALIRLKGSSRWAPAQFWTEFRMYSPMLSGPVNALSVLRTLNDRYKFLFNGKILNDSESPLSVCSAGRGQVPESPLSRASG